MVKSCPPCHGNCNQGRNCPNGEPMTNNRTESGPLEDSSGPIAGDAKDFAIAALEEKVRRLREALDSISEITREEYFIRSDSSRVQEIGSYARAALKDTE